MTALKFGKLAARVGPGHTVDLVRYLTPGSWFPAPASSVDWSKKLPTSLGMMLNDRLGDCTCAAAGHAIQLVTGNASSEVTVTDAAILRAYEAVSGYNPGTGDNDNGAVETDVLNYWRRVGVSGHRIVASGTVNHADTTLVKQLVAYLGFLYIGVQVPKAWEAGPNIWAVPTKAADRQIVGGHAIIVVGYDDHHLRIVSWGRVYRMTWAAFEKYCDEAHGVITPEWIEKTGDAPSGLDLAQLQADLAGIDQ